MCRRSFHRIPLSQPDAHPSYHAVTMICRPTPRLTLPLASLSLEQEMFIEVASWLATPDVLTLALLCKRAHELRDFLLAGILRRGHQICLKKDEAFLQNPRAILALTQFVKGGFLQCQRATLSSTTNPFLYRYVGASCPGCGVGVQREVVPNPDSGLLPRILSFLPYGTPGGSFFEQGTQPTHIHVSWQGIMFFSQETPPPHLRPLPWRCIMGESFRRGGPHAPGAGGTGLGRTQGKAWGRERVCRSRASFSRP